MKTGSVVLKFTRDEARSLGLLVCKCGWPENNHFDFGRKKCAHERRCSGYSETARVGKLVKPRKK